jgi:hypothetical protein
MKALWRMIWPFLVFTFSVFIAENWDKLRGVKEYPPIVTWYLTKFPRFLYACIMAGFIVIGLVMTILKLSPAIPTYIVCGMLIAVAPVHVVVWILKTKIDLK